MKSNPYPTAYPPIASLAQFRLSAHVIGLSRFFVPDLVADASGIPRS
jgi:hypothetical protein